MYILNQFVNVFDMISFIKSCFLILRAFWTRLLLKIKFLYLLKRQVYIVIWHQKYSNRSCFIESFKWNQNGFFAILNNRIVVLLLVLGECSIKILLFTLFPWGVLVRSRIDFDWLKELLLEMLAPILSVWSYILDDYSLYFVSF